MSIFSKWKNSRHYHLNLQTQANWSKGEASVWINSRWSVLNKTNRCCARQDSNPKSQMGGPAKGFYFISNSFHSHFTKLHLAMTATARYLVNSIDGFLFTLTTGSNVQIIFFNTIFNAVFVLSLLYLFQQWCWITILVWYWILAFRPGTDPGLILVGGG